MSVDFWGKNFLDEKIGYRAERSKTRIKGQGGDIPVMLFGTLTYNYIGGPDAIYLSTLHTLPFRESFRSALAKSKGSVLDYLKHLGLAFLLRFVFSDSDCRGRESESHNEQNVGHTRAFTISTMKGIARVIPKSAAYA